MNFLKIKYFPNRVEDYLYYCLSNVIYITILVCLIFQNLEQSKTNIKINEVILFIPKTANDFEEKRDLIFNQLSTNNSIISVNKIEDKDIKNLLSDILKNTNLSEEIIPEVYSLQVDKSKLINFELTNSKISRIINGALVLNFQNKKSNSLILLFSSFAITIFIILFANYFIIRNYLIKSKKYLCLSRYFGVTDYIIIRNFNISCFILLNLSFLLSYPIVIIVLEYYYNILTYRVSVIEVYLFIYFSYIFITLFVLSIQCNIFMKKNNAL